MIKKIMLLTAVFVLLSGQLLAQTDNEVNFSDFIVDNNSNFITLFLHGFYEGVQSDAQMRNPNILLGSRNKIPLVNYLLGNSIADDDSFAELPSPYADPEIKAYTNIMSYTMSGGFGNGFPEFPDRPFIAPKGSASLVYDLNPYKQYEKMSDILIEELGDFNSGSRYLLERGKRQCFISLAKSEWVYRNSTQLWSADLSDGKEDLINKLLINGPDFLELLSTDKYLIEQTELPSIIGLNNENSSLSQIAADLVKTAQRCPNTIRIIAHSMGGMYTMRYLSEDEDVYSSDMVGGFYQHYQEYTFEEYLWDVYGVSSFSEVEYNTETQKATVTDKHHFYYEYYEDLISSMRIHYKEKYPDLNSEELEKLIYLNLFKKERQNGVDKTVILDSPLNGVYGAQALDEELAPMLTSQEGFEKFKDNLSNSFMVNSVLASLEIVTGLFTPPPANVILISHGATCLTVDALMLAILLPSLVWTESSKHTGITVDIPWLGIKQNLPITADDLQSYKPDQLLWQDVLENSILVDTYNNEDPPDYAPYNKKQIDLHGLTVVTEEIEASKRENIEMHIFSVGVVPIFSNLGFLEYTDARQLSIIFGIWQPLFLANELKAVIEMLATGASQIGAEYHEIDWTLRTVFSVLGADWEYSTILIPETSSSGISPNRKIKPIYDNPNANIYFMDWRPKGYTTLNNLLIHDEFTNDGIDFPLDKDIYNDNIGNFDKFIKSEYLGSHGKTLDLLRYPIIRTAPNPDFLDNNNLIFFKGAVELWKTIEKAKPGDTNIFKSTPLFPEYNQIQGTELNNPDYPENLTRNLFYYTFFGIQDNKTNINFSVPNANLFENNITVYEAPNEDFTRGLYTNYIEPQNLMAKKTLDYLIFTNEVTVMPFAVNNYYPGLEFQYSINGSPFKDPIPLLQKTTVLNIDEYGDSMVTNVQSESSVVYDIKGNALILSPHFKEGYNTVVFKYYDPVGNYYYKNIQLMQLTVPPFVKPIYPLMNQYIGSDSLEIIIQALDIVNGDIKPENWFGDASIDLSIDGIPVACIVNENNFTISANVTGLENGNHQIDCKVNVYGLENTKSWRFWVDTTAPEIALPDQLIFSNQRQDNSNTLSFFIYDKVPFNYSDLDYSVDTVYLTELDAKVKKYGSDIEQLYLESQGRLGGFSKSWTGWINNMPLDHGTYQLEVSATDRVGNNKIESTDFIIDNQAPVLSELSLNSQLINLQSGLLELSYYMELDDWESVGYLDINIHNLTTNEEFTLSTEADFGQNNYTLTYFYKGVNVFKDGIYDISITSRDDLDNNSEPVIFTGIIVDRTKPVLENVYVNPFELNRDDNLVYLNFDVNENNDVVENLSQSLPVNVTLTDQYGNMVSYFTPLSWTLTSGSNYSYPVNLVNLPDGKYFFKLELTDKNGNTITEYASFIKNALAPEITYPEAYAFIEGITPIYGNVLDPKWNNTFPMDHYEVYYQFDEVPVPTDLTNIDGWLSEAIFVPAYQQSQEYEKNFGRFKVEGANVIANLDTNQLQEGLITILVIAEEESGLRMATTRTFRILKTGSEEIVDVQIDSVYKDNLYIFDYQAISALNIGYTVSHSLDNPVDIYTYIKDSQGKIVQQNSFYSLHSKDMVGEPLISTEDKGFFIYQDDAGRFNLVLKNDELEESLFLVNITSELPMSDFQIENDTSSNIQNFLFEENKKLLFVRSLEPGGLCKISFSADNSSNLTLNCLIDQALATVYIGANRQEELGGAVTVYPGNVYPPINWDGKDAWGRYVSNGQYTVGIEVYGKTAGYSEDSCQTEIITPFAFNIEEVDNKSIQPGVLSMESSSVQFKTNKGVSLQVEVLDSNDNYVTSVFASPRQYPVGGIYNFSWYGKDLFGNYVSDGIYKYRIICTVLDSGEILYFTEDLYPELSEIGFVTSQNLDPSLTTVIEDYPDATEFGGIQVVQGDNRYEIEIEANGQNLPDKDVQLDYDVKGTQIVDAYPDLNYMAAFRTNYEELWARIKTTEVRIKAKYSYYDFPRKKTITEYREYTIPLSKFSEQWVGSYNLENQQLTVRDFNSLMENAIGISTIVSSIEVPFSLILDTPLPLVYNLPLTDITIEGFTGNVLNGNLYMSSDVTYDNFSVNNWTTIPNGDNVDLTIDVSANVNCVTILDKSLYLSFSDGVTAIGPDVSADTRFVNILDSYENNEWITDIFNSTELTPFSGFDPQTDDETNIWPKKLRTVFYYVGENYDNPENDEYRQTYNDFFEISNYENLEIAIREDSNDFSNHVRFQVLPENFETGEFYNGQVKLNGITQPSLDTIIDSKVKFLLQKDNSTGHYSITVESTAYDKILLPFPENSIDFDIAHTVLDFENGISSVLINGERNNLNNEPNFIVPKYKINDPATQNVYFIEDEIDHAQALSTISFNQEVGYTGQFLLSQLVHSLPENVNVKQFYNLNLVSIPSGDVEFVGIPGIIDYNEESFDGLIINDDNILNISESQWSLVQDPVCEDTLSSEFTELDYEQFNKYDYLKSHRISEFYPNTSGNNFDPFSLFHYSEGSLDDNTSIIIDPDTRDYSGNNLSNEYRISLNAIDGSDYKGLQVNDVAYFGKGLKQQDGFVISKTSEAPELLLPIYGIAQGDFSVQYCSEDGVWYEIPITENSDNSEVLCYWNVTNLNGLFTLRLKSSLEDGSRINIAFKDVYIGHNVDTTFEDVSLISSNGQAKIIFPQSSLEEEAVISINTVDFENVQDVAVLPDIAPVGKVVKLLPDGMEFQNDQALPQLQFTFNKDELVDINPINLTIYQLKLDGELEPINTIKQLIKVEFDQDGKVLSENVVWDSELAGNSNIEGIDYTYVKAWTVLTHFSYYTIFEGNINNMPTIDQDSIHTSDPTFTMTGRGLSDSQLDLYITQSPSLSFEDTSLIPLLTTVSNDIGNYTFSDIPLLFEGDNYIYVGHVGSKSTEYNKLKIFRDTTPPELVVPSDIIAEANGLESIIDIGEVTVFDASKPVVITNNAPEGFPLGETIIIWMAVDQCENVSEMNQSITIVDTTPPVLTVPDDLTLEVLELTNNIDIGEAQVFDIFPCTVENDAPGVFNIGTTDVLWSATDENNNTISKIQHISLIYSLLGDVNHDGLINIVDSMLIGQYYSGMVIENFDTMLADVNKDEQINATDSLLVSQYYLGIIDEF